jgi:Kef-type K+ transport system membrane component KefB
MKTIYKIGLWILIIIGIILGVLYALQLTVAFIYLWIPIIFIGIYLLIKSSKIIYKMLQKKEKYMSPEEIEEELAEMV